MARAKMLEIFCGIRLSRARTPRTPVKAHAALNGRVAKSVRVAFQILRGHFILLAENFPACLGLTGTRVSPGSVPCYDQFIWNNSDSAAASAPHAYTSRERQSRKSSLCCANQQLIQEVTDDLGHYIGKNSQKDGPLINTG